MHSLAWWGVQCARHGMRAALHAGRRTESSFARLPVPADACVATLPAYPVLPGAQEIGRSPGVNVSEDDPGHGAVLPHKEPPEVSCMHGAIWRAAGGADAAAVGHGCAWVVSATPALQHQAGKVDFWQQACWLLHMRPLFLSAGSHYLLRGRASLGPRGLPASPLRWLSILTVSTASAWSWVMSPSGTESS